MKNLSDQTRLQIDENSTSKEYWDEKAIKAGFKSINNFLGYYELHSKTPRALFSGQHTELILALVGYSSQDREGVNPHNLFRSIGENFYDEMKNKVGSLI